MTSEIMAYWIMCLVLHIIVRKIWEQAIRLMCWRLFLIYYFFFKSHNSQCLKVIITLNIFIEKTVSFWILSTTNHYVNSCEETYLIYNQYNYCFLIFFFSETRQRGGLQVYIFTIFITAFLPFISCVQICLAI